jgi:hypothetical protein
VFRRTYQPSFAKKHNADDKPEDCTIATLRHYNIAPLQHCNIAPPHHCNIAQLHHCNIAPLQHCTTAPLQHCTTAALQHCTTAPHLLSLTPLTQRPTSTANSVPYPFTGSPH